MSKPGRSGESSSGQGLVGAIFLTVIHSVLLVGLLIILVTVVPRYTQTFDDFGLELPLISVYVIQVSSAAVTYWYVFVFSGCVVMALDFVILLMLGRIGHITQFAVGFLIALVALLLGGLVLQGIWVPMTMLVENLK